MQSRQIALNTVPLCLLRILSRIILVSGIDTNGIVQEGIDTETLPWQPFQHNLVSKFKQNTENQKGKHRPNCISVYYIRMPSVYQNPCNLTIQ